MTVAANIDKTPASVPGDPIARRKVSGATVVSRTLQYALIGVLAAFCIVPFGWLIATSVDSHAGNVLQWPGLTLEHYGKLFTQAGTIQLLGNSLLIAVGATLLTMLLGFVGGYALSRFRFHGRRFFMFFILLIRVVPPTATIVPLYLLMTKIHLNNSLFGLILVEAASLLPLTLWQMKGAVDAVPLEIEEAGWVDGSTRLNAVGRIVFPVIGPTFGAAAIFAFVGAWGDFLTPLVLLQSQDLYPLSIGLFRAFSGFNQVDWGLLTATAIIYMIPPTLLYLVVRKYLFKAAISGAVKG